MQITASFRGLRRLFFHSVAAMAMVASTAFAIRASAQANPPRPPRAGRVGDSVGPRPMNPPGMRGRMGPGMGPGGMQPGGMGAGGMGRRGGRHGGGNRNPASGFLRMREQLDLSDDQVKRLEALQAAPAPRRNESDALRARADLMDATRGDGNMGAARNALERMSRVRNEQVLAGLKARQDARNVLTAAQKARIDNLRGEMRGEMRGKARDRMRQGGMGKGGMRKGSMRQGGRQGGMGPQFGPGRGMRQGARPLMPPVPPRRRGEDQVR